MTTEFKDFGKIPRLARDCVITEKLDGTNAQIYIRPYVDEDFNAHLDMLLEGDLAMRCGSRNRWISPEDDNHGFARWAYENAPLLVRLGPGRHFGEWWGAGIQRRYGLAEKRFSLFNTGRWVDSRDLRIGAGGYPGRDVAPECCHVVPVLYAGPFSTDRVNEVLRRLSASGSAAAPGFMDPEGVIVYHAASGGRFKQTINDDDGKTQKVPMA